MIFLAGRLFVLFDIFYFDGIGFVPLVWLSIMVCGPMIIVIGIYFVVPIYFSICDIR